MTISILSDVHLGLRMFRKTLVPENINAIEYKGYEQWNNCLDNVIEEKPDLLVISGDIFHDANPRSLAIDNAIQGFDKLNRNNIKTIVIGGNHDSSLTNEIVETNPLKNIDSFENVKFIYDKVTFLEFENTLLTFIPHFNFNISSKKDMQKDMNSIIKKVIVKTKNIDKKKVLITHGVIDSWVKRFMNKKENEKYHTGAMCFPDDFVNRFDYVIIGHVHTPFVQNVFDNINESKRIVPGAMLGTNTFDLTNDTSIPGTGPLYLDTESGNLKREIIESVKIIKKFIKKKEDLDSLMSNVGFNAYFINYAGEWEDVDLNLYNKAVKESLHFNLQVKPTKRIQNIPASVQDFWSWLSKSHPDYFIEFKEIIKGE